MANSLDGLFMQVGSIFALMMICFGIPGQFIASAAERFTLKRGIAWLLNFPACTLIAASALLRADWWLLSCNALGAAFSLMILVRLLRNSWSHRAAERMIRRGKLIRDPSGNLLDSADIQ